EGIILALPHIALTNQYNRCKDKLFNCSKVMN
ncbi:MAG: hypothetical protein ACI9HU_001977, partial [Colwellia sp.]